MDLIEQYRTMHKAGHFAGLSLLKHREAIGKLIKDTGAESVLDYGSGKGQQYFKHQVHKDWGLTPFLYDPAVVSISSLPEREFDGVICTDVLEHIPEQDLDGVIADILKRGRKFVYIAVCTRPASKSLPDGRNAHLTVRPIEWWRQKIGDKAVVVEHD